MDNASTHMAHGVRDMIMERGAYLLYTALYLPDLLPIEYGFHIYKSQLKRHSKDFESEEWWLLHKKAISSVSKDTAIMEFRKCGIPFSHDISTSNERNNLNII